MLEVLKNQVLEANLELQNHHLVVYTWGNASGIDRESGLIVIKPSGVPYGELRADHMVVLDLDGRIVEGTLNPSSDTPTHIELYRSFPEIGGVVHTHSSWATAWAQAGVGIPCLGTTHADYFYGEIPCTRPLTTGEIRNDYELNTGKIIAECFTKLDYRQIPGVLVTNHGPFRWGKDPAEAVYHSVVLEEVAKTGWATLGLRSITARRITGIPQELLDKHFLRKHGRNAYYGQKDHS